MFGSFQKAFKPTEKDKEERVIRYLHILIDSIASKNCGTCKHHETRYSEDHSEIWCKKHDKFCIKFTCDDYEVCKINDLLK